MTEQSKPLRVGIVGGSIAGCTAAIELHRLGHQVMVFERSRGQLEDRGAGIASALPHLEMLKERDLIDPDYPYVLMTRSIWTTAQADNPEGRLFWRRAGAAGGMNWGVLFANLRHRVPDEIYHCGRSVTDLSEHDDNTVTLQLDNGEQHTFDLVIFADGYHSWGRQYLFPEAEMTYAGYVIWRGTISESEQPPEWEKPVSEWAVHEGGLCIFYTIPGQHGECGDGQRVLNWAWYNLTPADQLAELLTDKDGKTHLTSLPQGAATAAHKLTIRQRAREMLRESAAGVIANTAEPYIQVVYDLHVPSYQRGRICLIGDASSIARPHTGAGAIRAQQQAIALAKALAEHAAVDDALHAWNAEVWEAGDQQVNLGKILGRALLTDAPDWQRMKPEHMPEWWQKATTGVYVYYYDDEVAEK